MFAQPRQRLKTLAAVEKKLPNGCINFSPVNKQPF
jgi:hypothetical protein